jgi:5-methylcytosine-specific restriction endonuclease McrBC GTP-binding regulatory subunit McrB
MLRNQFTKVRSYLWRTNKESKLIKEIDNILEGFGLHPKTKIDKSNISDEILEEVVSVENKIKALEERNNKRKKGK